MRRFAPLLLAGCASAAPAPPRPARCPEPASAAPVAAPEPAPPEAVGEVVLDGTPEVPAQVRARIARYRETRSASVEAISDDGRTLIVATRFAETAQIHEVRMPMGDRRQITFGDEPARAAEIQPDGSVLYMGDVGGAENFQIYRLDRQGGATTLLTDGRSRHAEYAVSREGTRIAYNGNARKRARHGHLPRGRTDGGRRRDLPRAAGALVADRVLARRQGPARAGGRVDQRPSPARRRLWRRRRCAPSRRRRRRRRTGRRPSGPRETSCTWRPTGKGSSSSCTRSRRPARRRRGGP